MPAHQTTYTNISANAYAGMIADSEFTTVLSHEITTAAAGFGLAVGRGAADRTARLGGTGFVGITVADKANINATYGIGDQAGCMVKGCVWVVASNTVTPADPVTFTAATGVIGAGLVTTITGARFLASATVGVLVPVLLA